MGHNRANATPDNCTSYYAEEEVERREKKREKNKRKAQQTKDEIAELEKNGQDRDAKLKAAEEALAVLKASSIADDKMRENEVKRLKRKQARAEKQANK